MPKVGYKSSESAGFSFAFHQFQDVTDSDGTFNVPDEVTLLGFFTCDEDNLDLSNTST
jgi:hypothetical protein